MSLEEVFSVDRCAQGDVATVENFDRLMAVNVRGTMLCYKHAGKQMVAQGHGGRIIGAYSTPFLKKIALRSIFRGLFNSGQTG